MKPTIYIYASNQRGGRSPRYSAMVEAVATIARDYGETLPDMEWRRLDLRAAGRAFVDLTDIKGLHFRQFLTAKKVVDLWWRVKGREFMPGRGYEEWLWQSVYAFLKVSGEGGLPWRLVVD